MTAVPLQRTLRVRSWPVDPTTAHLVPTAGRQLTVAEVRAVLADLGRAGYERARTAALSPAEARPFLAAGFAVDEHLHLLAHDRTTLPRPRPEAALRRGRRRDRPAVLAVDAAAFSPLWRLDAAGLRDALTATPVARLRVAVAPTGAPAGDGVVGYAVTGKAGPRGYLQRVAVTPDHAGAGRGHDLVLDGLRWLARRGARGAVVNTQEGNEAALALYHRLGFHPEPDGLDVLGTALP
jgi:ribosomal protein S18 acetylase RimI-like enzyme